MLLASSVTPLASQELEMAAIGVVLTIGFSAVLICLALLFRRAGSSSPALESLERRVEGQTERLDRSVRDEAARLRSDLGSTLSGLLETRLSSLDTSLEGRLAAVRDELGQQRTALSDSLQRSTETTATRISSVLDKNDAAFTDFVQHLGHFETKLDGRFETLRGTVDARLGLIQQDNAARLAEMRATVEEKLQSTLDRRVGESFARVSQQLEQVHRALGEMQTLSEHVGDLRRVMANVRARGALGEWRLEALLQELLTADQYERNVQPVPGVSSTVEFAIRMPSSGVAGAQIWLPVDSKFPVEAYERVVAAQDAGDREALDAARRDLAGAIKTAAKDIHDKYISPPNTTEYGILFLPTESLFAEVVRFPSLNEDVHRQYRVMIAGPTTFATLLNALQMGFRTVALAERANEVWTVLGAVRTEFGKFSEAMVLVKKKLEQAASAVDRVEVRRRAIGRKLRSVDTLPARSGESVLSLPASSDLLEDAPDDEHPDDGADASMVAATAEIAD